MPAYDDGSLFLTHAKFYPRQLHLPDSEPSASHVSSGDEDKGRRLVREYPDCHFIARPRTWGLARMEWM